MKDSKHKMRKPGLFDRFSLWFEWIVSLPPASLLAIAWTALWFMLSWYREWEEDTLNLVSIVGDSITVLTVFVFSAAQRRGFGGLNAKINYVIYLLKELLNHFNISYKQEDDIYKAEKWNEKSQDGFTNDLMRG